MSALLLALVLLAAAAYLAGAVIVTRRFAMRRRRAAGGPRHGAAPPVSVLKPLHGLDAGLAQNLRSFADQQYPRFQLVFGVRERTDRALPVARALIAARPEADIELIVDATAAGSNRKVANLENMLPAARHDVLVIADSDMRVTPDYLAAVTAPLGDPRTGLVTCLYKAAPVGGLWSQLAALHINFGFLPGALVGEALGVGGGCFGATIALRREVFERIGGFARVRNELADDHRMGAAVRRLGLRTVLSTYIVENQVHEPTLASLWRHELRWARTSRTMAPAGYAGSLVTHTVAISVLGAALLGSPAAWGLVPAALALRWLSAAMIAGALGLPRRGLWLLPLRDALSFAVFVGSFCGRSVRWRGQRLRVMPSGRISVERDKPV
ncbi:MAG TPA: bacteriohopanetetrol glucosamine biosynthesis glycosyltransferase HpnI [Stellaceae bacterium]|nr:bacteriohopanetetrol glucosamine biosynthesis glycosyltransferase HpnI [Stellaceae bacterium]